MAVHRGGLQLAGLQAFLHREYGTRTKHMSLLRTWRTRIRQYAVHNIHDKRHPAICAVIAGDVVPVSDFMGIIVQYAQFSTRALYLAVMLHHTSIVRILLDAHLEIPDATMRLCFAMAQNDDIIRMLFEHITDNVTTLWEAVLRNNVFATRLLLSVGTPCHNTLCTPFGDTLLHAAVRRGYTTLVELIVAHTTDVDIRNTRNRTALYYADSVPIAKILLDAGASLFPHQSASIVETVGYAYNTMDIAALVLTYACTCKRTEEDIAIFLSEGKCSCTRTAIANCLVLQCARRLRILRQCHEMESRRMAGLMVK